MSLQPTHLRSLHGSCRAASCWLPIGSQRPAGRTAGWQSHSATAAHGPPAAGAVRPYTLGDHTQLRHCGSAHYPGFKVLLLTRYIHTPYPVISNVCTHVCVGSGAMQSVGLSPSVVRDITFNAALNYLIICVWQVTRCTPSCLSNQRMMTLCFRVIQSTELFETINRFVGWWE